MFQLFSTLGCHLCDDAKNILDPLVRKYGSSYSEVEISDSDEWVDKYGIRIPVLRSTSTQQELDWPFDSVECEEWLQKNLHVE